VGGEGGTAHGPAAGLLALEGGLGAHVEQQQVAGAAAAAGQAGQQPPAPAAGAGVVDEQAAAAGQGEQDPQAVPGMDQRPPEPVGKGVEEALEPGPDRLGSRTSDPGASTRDSRVVLPAPGTPATTSRAAGGRRSTPGPDGTSRPGASSFIMAATISAPAESRRKGCEVRLCQDGAPGSRSRW